MSLALRLTFISIILTTSAYLFSYGYVESLDIPIVPNFETSYYFFFKAYITPKTILTTLILCLVMYWFISDKDKNKTLKKSLKILFGILIFQAIMLALAFYDKFQEVFFPFFFLIITIISMLDNNLVPYSEDGTEKIKTENILSIVTSSLLTIMIFYFYGSIFYKSQNFNQITINPQTNIEFKVRPLWTQSGNIYAITCPKHFHTSLPTSIMEYNNGKTTYELNNLPSGMVRSICKYSAK